MNDARHPHPAATHAADRHAVDEHDFDGHAIDARAHEDARKAQRPIKGRGAASYVSGRYEKTVRRGEDDGWGSVYDHSLVEGEADALPQLDTRVTEERARSIISRNDSPDIGFSQSVNPYRGC